MADLIVHQPGRRASVPAPACGGAQARRLHGAVSAGRHSASAPRPGSARAKGPTINRLLAAVVTGCLLAGGCAPAPAGPPEAQAPPPVADATSPAPPRGPTDPAPGSAAPHPDPPTSPAAAFRGAVAPIDAATRARMTHSWRPGCPVALEDLRLLTVRHWGFDGAVHHGELIVHRDQAGAVLQALQALFAAAFPIERMELVDAYGGDDDRSMAANNTSAFNCRTVAGRPGVWSEHAYGRAIDINPVQNPYVTPDGTVSPPAGAPYADRSRTDPGMIRPGDAAVTAFAAVGWGWGGSWSSVKDYQHFSASGR